MRSLLFPLLLAGHMLGDWVVQTDWQAANKATSWRANQAHICTYHLCLIACLVPYWVWANAGTSVFRYASGIAASWVLHSLIDRRWPVRRLLEATGSPDFAKTTLGVLAADQTLHVLTLAAVAVWWVAP